MQSITVTIDNETLSCLERAAKRDFKSVNEAILEGIASYLEGEASAHDAPDAIARRGFATGLN
jgi:metal-responsive CopG/Arc/MetJ family transcriptional regulator